MFQLHMYNHMFSDFLYIGVFVYYREQEHFFHNFKRLSNALRAARLKLNIQMVRTSVLIKNGMVVKDN